MSRVKGDLRTQDDSVRDWVEERRLRSALSADVYRRQLASTLRRLELSTAQVAEMARTDPSELRRRLSTYAKKLQDEGRLDSYIKKTYDGLRSYLKFRGITFDGFPKLSPARGESLSKERVPSQSEFGQVLEHLSLRGRVIALVMAHAGVRPGVIGSYGGRAGLRLGDLPELNLESSEFSETPFVVSIPASLSKTRASYTTFGTAQLGSALLAYIAERKKGGERLNAKSPVVTSTSDVRGVAARSLDRAGGRFLTTKAVVEEIRDVLRAETPTNVTWRPYVLRSYCSTRLLLAEGAVKITRDLREAILGHDGGAAARYHVGKRRGHELLEEARREYREAASFLETNAQSRVDVAAEFRRTLLSVAGLSEQEVAAHANDSNESLLAILRERLAGAPDSTPPRESREPRRLQKPVPVQEAERLLGAGWTFVANFSDGRVLLQEPPA